MSRLPLFLTGGKQLTGGDDEDEISQGCFQVR